MKTWLQVMISIQTFWTKIITWNWVSVIKKKKKICVYFMCNRAISNGHCPIYYI